MAKSPLTNTQIKQIKPSDKVITLSDGDGLQFRIKPTGSKLWQLRYKNPFTKTYTVMGLGKYPVQLDQNINLWPGLLGH